MNQTQYEDTNGLSDSTVSSLEDTFKLLQYVHSYKPFMLKVLSLDSYSFGSLTQTSLNPLQKQEGYVAGFADNKKTEMITIMAIDVKGESTLTPIQKKFAILVQSDSDGNTEEETKKIYEWITNSVVVRENK
jgi:D-alanyl-D-alanine carboxypeptidase